MKRDADPALAPAKASAVFWKTTELAVLRENYSTLGPSACAELLPGRSIGAIVQRASMLKLPAPPRTWSRLRGEVFDTAVRQLYQQTPERGAIKAAADRMKIPRWVLTSRARELGLIVPRFKEPDWTEAEDELLAEHAAKLPKTIARIFREHGFPRTLSAITVRLKRKNVDRIDDDHWSASALSKLMGVDAKTVLGWIHTEGLTAKRRGTERTPQQGGDTYIVSRRNLRLWIAAHAQLVDLRKVDRYWFIDLAFGGAK